MKIFKYKNEDIQCVVLLFSFFIAKIIKLGKNIFCIVIRYAAILFFFCKRNLVLLSVSMINTNPNSRESNNKKILIELF